MAEIDPPDTLSENTESANASKGMVVLVPHGLCGKNGVTSTISKMVKKEGPETNPLINNTTIVGPVASFEI